VTAWGGKPERFYDPYGRLTSRRDALGRTVTLQWCVCGSLDALTDAKGQKTSWDRDLEGRITREIRPDGLASVVNAYAPKSGRLQSTTDAKRQVTTYTYNLDNSVQSVVYTNAQIATPSVNFTYDSDYSRLATMVDGTGTTAYTYQAPGQLGAGHLAMIDGPLANDNVTYAYDELGRLTSRTVNAVPTTLTYVVLGRMSTETNALGMFTFAYEGATGRISSVAYPNGQATSFSYFDNLGDHQLQTVLDTRTGGAMLARLDYTYDATGNILSWRQQSNGDPAVEWRYTYDAADELLTATKWSTADVPSILQAY
jgi:YD repeat-containing protein